MLFESRSRMAMNKYLVIFFVFVFEIVQARQNIVSWQQRAISRDTYRGNRGTVEPAQTV